VVRLHNLRRPYYEPLVWFMMMKCCRDWSRKETTLVRYSQSHIPLKRSNFFASLKNALSVAGINLEKFSSHSFRKEWPQLQDRNGHSFKIGVATTAAKCGLSDSAIQQLGRWRSSAYKRYIRHSSSTLAMLTSSISSTPS